MADLEKAKNLKKEIESLNGILIAVSKKFPASDVESVYNSGVRDFGENYISEAVQKIDELKHLDIKWHFIGRVQSGNLNKLVNRFYMIHSLCKLEHIKKINERSAKKQKILLQLQHPSDSRGFGLSDLELSRLIVDAPSFEKIDFSGLMFMPPAKMKAEDLKNAFLWANTVFESMKIKTSKANSSWNTLSMGMSADFDLALASGSTHVRMGTAIFGQRNTED